MRQLIVVALPALAVLWATGWFRRQARKSVWSAGNTIVGAVGVWAALTWLWRNRRDAINVVAVVVLCAAVATFLGAWWLLPEQRLTLTAPVLVAALCAYLAWDYRKTKGAPLLDMLALMRAETQVRNAVHATHDNARVTRVERTDAGWRAEVDHVGPVDAEAVGQTLNAGDARVQVTDKLGRSTVVLEDRVGGWERFATPVEWKRPSRILMPGAPISFAVDADGNDLTVPWPGSGGAHLLGAGATGSGKSGLLRVLIAELAYRPNTTLVLIDPKRVEFRSWRQRAFVASGVAEAARAFDRVVAEMMRRYDSLPEDQVEWTNADGAWIQMVIDEHAALTKIGTAKERARREEALEVIAAMGRAAGIGLTDFTQRTSSKAMDLEFRDNFRVRVGLGSESIQATTMIMGDSADKAPCHAIPESKPGCCFIRVDRNPVPARVKLLDPLEVRAIAAETAQNQGDVSWLEA